MNILLWVLQILLALHTIMGAVWKISNSEQTVPSLKAIPHEIWLILAIFNKSMGKLIPVAAICIAAEMLLFSGLYVFSGDGNYGQMIYWLIVAAICAFIAYGRSVLKS